MNIERIVVGPVSTNCYIVYDESGAAVVIDPGDDAPKLLSFIRERSLELKYILLTHGHFDHIMAVGDLKKATGAELVIAAGDADYLRNPDISLATRVGKTHESIEPDRVAGDGDIFDAGGMSFKYLLTPGHTAGSAVILSGEAMFSGDTLFQGDCGRCDLPGGDYAEMLRSLKRLYDLPGDYKVYPGHDVSTTLAVERVDNVNMLEAVDRLGR